MFDVKVEINSEHLEEAIEKSVSEAIQYWFSHYLNEDIVHEEVVNLFSDDFAKALRKGMKSTAIDAIIERKVVEAMKNA